MDLGLAQQKQSDPWLMCLSTLTAPNNALGQQGPPLQLLCVPKNEPAHCSQGTGHVKNLMRSCYFANMTNFLFPSYHMRMLPDFKI